MKPRIEKGHENVRTSKSFPLTIIYGHLQPRFFHGRIDDYANSAAVRSHSRQFESRTQITLQSPGSEAKFRRQALRQL